MPIPITSLPGQLSIDGAAIAWEADGENSLMARIPVPFEDEFAATPQVLPTVQQMCIAPGDPVRLVVSVVAATRMGFDLVVRIPAAQRAQLIDCVIFWYARV